MGTMSLTPETHRTLTRPRSSPSLAVGLPPAPPEANIMIRSSPALKRPRSQPRIRRGDVSSSAATSEDEATPKIGKGTPRMLQTPSRLKVQSPLALTRSPRVLGTLNVSHEKVVVCIRVKPSVSRFAATAYEISETSLTLSDSHPNVKRRGGKAGREEEYVYPADKVLCRPETTADLYEAKIAPMVEKAMNGFNSTVFAFGQSGSGKSYTMTGNEDELGIIPCAVDGVFDAINDDSERAFLLRVSYIEIYNETLRDLLGQDGQKLGIFSAKGKTYVEPLKEEIVSTPHDVMRVLQKGNTARKVGATDWNERSSRSHCVFTITIESRPRSGNDDVRMSRLSLIDLAGSEKAVSDAERRGEGRHINRSLLALREVINKLTDKKSAHIPYRDSKLTHLLENALGGDSNICVICTVSPEQEHYTETLETLKFASRCSQVETKAKKNVLLSTESALIRAKDMEIAELRRRLEESGENNDASQLMESVTAMETRKARLAEQLAKLNAEILTSEPIPSSKRRRISENLKPKKMVVDRRIFSQMTRVNEESELFTLDAESIAVLRRKLAAKDQEIAALKQEMISRKAREDLHARDRHAEMESSRAELLAILDSKMRKIDELENVILDLRRSREDVAIEDQQLLEAEQKRLADMELHYARDVSALKLENEDLKKRLVDLERQLAETQARLAVAEQERDVAMKEARRNDTEGQQVMTEVASLRKTLKEKEHHLGCAVTKNGNLQLDIISLKEELEDARSDALPSRRGHLSSTSVPNLSSATVLDTLRNQHLTSTATGQGSHQSRLRTLERDEIDRLDKIVEVQKAMIDDQRSKIQYWADAVEQQREIVRQLSEQNDSPSPIKKARPHKDHNNFKPSLPSTFTAFNLALPTTPTPLPPHPSQFSNTTGRRRVTIRNDMQKLGESSKVNITRGRFDIPGEQPPSPTKGGHTTNSSSDLYKLSRRL